MRTSRTQKLPTLSVVIAAYNEASSIQQCLRALHTQAAVIHEVIVIDNNSTDGTAKLARQMGYSEVKVVAEKQQGLIFARNTGFRVATGDIVARVDADTYVEPGWAQSIREFFADLANDDVWGVSGPIGYHDAPFPEFIKRISNGYANSVNAFSGSSQSLSGCNQAIRRDEWSRIVSQLCARRSIMEDLDTTLHIRQAGGAVKIVPGMVVATSLRRVASPPYIFWRYIAMLPRTYWIHQKHVEACVMFVAACLMAVLQLLVFPILIAYDPRVQKFSWKQLVRGLNAGHKDIP